MSDISQLQPITPAQIRAALTRHLAKKLGWCGKTAAHVLGPLSNDDIARCLAEDADATRRALFARSCAALADAGLMQAVA
ncbi:hypothetical protein [Methylobacterium sp.]|uniref:hypothetical protein n=1 Tax=Methylobacterium sp. TaxID=409 RepID=UPI003B59FE87